MKKGQIVRAKRHCGIPTGAYLRIKKVQGNIVHVEALNSSFTQMTLQKTSVYELKVVKLVVPDFVVDRIKSGIQTAIIHDLSPKWEKLKNIKPEVVSIRSIKYSEKFVICSVKDIRTVYYNRKPQVRLEIPEILQIHDKVY